MFLHVVWHLHAAQPPAHLLQLGPGAAVQDGWLLISKHISAELIFSCYTLPSFILFCVFYYYQPQVWLWITLVPSLLRNYFATLQQHKLWLVTHPDGHGQYTGALRHARGDDCAPYRCLRLRRGARDPRGDFLGREMRGCCIIKLSSKEIFDIIRGYNHPITLIVLLTV